MTQWAQIGGRALREMTRIAHSPYSMWRDIASPTAGISKTSLLRFEQQLARSCARTCAAQPCVISSRTQICTDKRMARASLSGKIHSRPEESPALIVADGTNAFPSSVAAGRSVAIFLSTARSIPERSRMSCVGLLAKASISPRSRRNDSHIRSDRCRRGRSASMPVGCVSRNRPQ